MKPNLLTKLTKSSGLATLIIFVFISIQSVSASDYRSGYKKSYKYSPTIADFVGKVHGFETLALALDLAGLTDALDGYKSLTLFAPTNDAFQALADVCPAVGGTGEEGSGDVLALAGALKGADLLDDVLLYHVAKYPRSLESLLKRRSVKPLIGGELKTGVDTGGAFVEGEINAELNLANPSDITVEGLKVRNGIIYPISNVLLNVDPRELCGIKNG